jgi:2-octaprenyl-6-methoxyphenol hydroxylase
MSATVTVVGGGPVGLAFAIAASHLRGLNLQVFERGADCWDTLPGEVDHRVYALSPASISFLATIGVLLPADRVAPVRGMQVWGDDNPGSGNRLDLNGGQPLAHIVEHAVLMHALCKRLEGNARVHLQRGVMPTGLDLASGKASLCFAGQPDVAADLLVAADGRQSRIREWANIPTTSKDYESDGVVANFQCEQHHCDTARQWFTANGVLALLPLPGNYVSMVWSVSRQLSAELPFENPAEMAEMVMRECGWALGSLKLISRLERFPLARVTATNWVQPGLALMGDAAHAVHPLAGQGVNLGFADAEAMCDLIACRSRFSAVGDVALLRRYERNRREAAWAVGMVTDQLRSLYLSDANAAKWLRNQGVGLLNRVPAAKAQLIDYAAG